MRGFADTRRIGAQVRKELTQIVRDRTALVLAMVLPVILLTVLGNAISLSVRDIPIIVQDLDDSPASRSLIEAYRSSLTFRVVPWPVERAPVRALEENTARGAVIIPEHFSRDLARGTPTDIEVLVDATDANTANILRGKLSAITASFAADRAHARPQGVVTADVRLWYNPGRQDASFIGPGALVVTLSLLPPLIAALATSRERERNTILQVYVSGVSAFDYVAGKVVAFVLIAGVDWMLSMLTLHTVFGLRLRGDVSAFLVGSVFFLFTVISFGVMVGVRVPEQASALQAMQLGGFVLSYLLSGFIFPLSNVPSPLRVLSNLTPARYYLVIVRDAFLRGGGWPAVWPHVSALLLLFLTFFGLAWRRIRRMQLEA